ncbi:rplI [Wigglesworthia glossinidia endosymbiont of Glossina brevipalpis]|uniref:Large ribosomal subunit protein bL9 n=1 Tax=Wigglesworthia glossinidia brevipalpis TaxID=36870 RepID=RL9_WIGBR|nr:RecName: Full=Large ribosomal subunit protein bL9; AltName: Full=50S ribosomal protein L9 [Wigglesworthia glossinidia endosymbiont of Glossina brevipalpis]BAC24406.1 rplI [Wigglesworthia glossinidia endosymbiont of Glossina brevipalpis]
MQIILLKKIINKGNIGDKIKVKAGYARNFLFPKKIAIIASEKNLKFFEKKRKILEEQSKYENFKLKERFRNIKSLKEIEIYCKAGSKGKLFGSIGANHIIEKIKERGIRIMKNEIKLTNGPLKTIGKHNIKIKVKSNMCTEICVILKNNI